MTPGSEDSEHSREEGSIYHDTLGNGVRASALPPYISRHTTAAVAPYVAGVDPYEARFMGRTDTALSGVTGWRLASYVPPSPPEAHSLAIRGSTPARTAQPEEQVANSNHPGGKKQASTNIVNESEDKTPDAPLSSPFEVTASFKQAHTTFVFIHKDTGQRSSRAFNLCDSLHKLFRRAQIACTIAPGTSDGALAVNVNGTMKNVAQQDGEDDFREMLEAIWQSAFWTSEDENVMCEVRVRELVLV